MLCIVFYLNLRLKYVVKYVVLFFCKYPRVSVDIKKLCWYPHNGYPIDMDTGTRHIFIQRVGYKGCTTCNLPAPLISLDTTEFRLGPTQSNLDVSLPSQILDSDDSNQSLNGGA